MGKWKRSVERDAWTNMIHACYNEEHKAYRLYGAKGVTVCAEWRCRETGYDQFFADVGKKPQPGLRLTRLDKRLPYQPGNAVWSDRTPGLAAKQFPINGVSKTLREWSLESGILLDTMKARARAGATGLQLIEPLYSGRTDKGVKRTRKSDLYL